MKGGARQLAQELSRPAKRKRDDYEPSDYHDEPHAKVRVHDPTDIPPTPNTEDIQEYRKYVAGIFFQNQMSSKYIQKSSHLSSCAGAQGVADYGAAGTSGKHGGNHHRDLLTHTHTKGTILSRFILGGDSNP